MNQKLHIPKLSQYGYNKSDIADLSKKVANALEGSFKGNPIPFNENSAKEVLNKLIFPFNKFDLTALEYKPFTRFTIAKSLDDLSDNYLSKFLKTVKAFIVLVTVLIIVLINFFY